MERASLMDILSGPNPDLEFPSIPAEGGPNG